MTDDASSRPTIHRPYRHTAPAPEEVAEHFPDLEILEVLGAGGMGVVYKARQRRLDRLVALKILPPDPDRDVLFNERFDREARAMARLHHPNIVTIHDSGQTGPYYYLVMEFVEGVNLREMMSSGHLEPSRALAIIPAICDALQYAHDEGVMHRDIKPENVLIDTRGRVKIADFGLAKLLAAPDTAVALTAPAQVLGTMHYMAPEQIEHPNHVDHRADIYALGVVLYEMLTGELPIGRFPLPSERTPIDPRLDQVVLKALEKEPDRRYQRITDVKTDVEFVAPPVGAPAPTIATVSGAVQPSSAGSFVHTPSMPHVLRAPKSVGIAYILWFCCFFGLAGMHRFYAGRWVTGIIWLCTGGLLMFGQFIDLLLIPGIIRIRNLEDALMAGAVPAPGAPPPAPSAVRGTTGV
jgi:serine/threonine protein kinase